MIRVNLLPHAAERRSAPESSQTWLLLVMGVVVVEIAALFFFHQTKEDELATIQGQVQKLNNQIANIQALVKDHKKVKEALVVLRAREDAIAKLQTDRKGPTAVLLELSKVLTRGKGPTADPRKLEEQRQNNPLAIYDVSWDPRRVWLTRYDEAETKRKLSLLGVARDANDVTELAQRLRLSRYFDDVRLEPGDKDPATDLVKFGLKMKVKY